MSRASVGLDLFINHIKADKYFRWFDLWARSDKGRIAFLVEREWEAMNDLEQEPFMRSESKGERIRGGLSIGTVLDARQNLHDKFNPRDLHYLEFMVKTKPRRPFGTRFWFNKLQEVKSDEVISKLGDLSPENEKVTRFCEGCASLDRLRYNFEKNAWFTTLLQIDLEANEFRLSHFHSAEIDKCEAKFNEAIRNYDLPGPMRIRRPRGPFSLWIEDYRYMIRDEKPEFQFGKHLRMCAESWAELSDEKKQELKERSIKLKEDYLFRQKEYEEKYNLKLSDETYKNLFNHTRTHCPNHPSHLIPVVPSVLDLYGRHLGITDKKLLKARWESLSKIEQQYYVDERKRLKSEQESKRSDIKARVKVIKEQVWQCLELVRLKKSLGLIQD